MIAARPQPDFDQLVTALAAQAGAEAQAAAQSRQLAGAADPLRWRRPALLWPTFTKG